MCDVSNNAEFSEENIIHSDFLKVANLERKKK